MIPKSNVSQSRLGKFDNEKKSEKNVHPCPRKEFQTLEKWKKTMGKLMCMNQSCHDVESTCPLHSPHIFGVIVHALHFFSP